MKYEEGDLVSLVSKQARVRREYDKCNFPSTPTPNLTRSRDKYVHAGSWRLIYQPNPKQSAAPARSPTTHAKLHSYPRGTAKHKVLRLGRNHQTSHPGSSVHVLACASALV